MVRLDWERLRPIDLILISQWGTMSSEDCYKSVLAICDNLVDGGVSMRPLADAHAIIKLFLRELPEALPCVMDSLCRERPALPLLLGLAAVTVQPPSDPHLAN